VRLAVLRIGALMLSLLLCAATNRSSPAGFVNLPHVMTVHPLHKMLDAYDREIAALQRTETVEGLDDPAAEARRSGEAVARDAAAAERRIRSIAPRDAGADHMRERQALSALAASESAADREMNAYRNALVRETNANLRGYSQAIAARNARALAGRRQQLLEKELTLAYDLARRDAAKRLMLRLRLQDLHLERAARARLQAERSAMDARESAAVAAMRRDDAAALDAYRRRLQRDGDDANATMSAQLRAKADANLALRVRVVQAELSSASALPNLPARLDWFASTYRFGSDVPAIAGGMRAAGADLSQRFGQLAATDRQSRTQIHLQIERLKTSRRELYGSMTAQIVRDAQRLATLRHLHGVVVSNSRPRGSVDLTAALAAEVARF
jgi:hypothetical protein